jgi:hypothetical protein
MEATKEKVAKAKTSSKTKSSKADTTKAATDKSTNSVLKPISVDRIVTQVYATFDYDKFSFLTGNRHCIPIHVKRLMNSFEKMYLISPILVNEKYEIIDGQHRFTGAREQGKEIYYIMIPGYSLKEVKVLNTHNLNWTKLDYLKAYVDEGQPNYIIMNEFMRNYPEFGIASIESILTLRHNGSNSSTKVTGRMKNFEEGKLDIPDLELSTTYAEQLIRLKPFHPEMTRSFVSATLSIFKNPRFDFDEFIAKLRLQPNALERMPTVTKYKLLMENIYNYMRRDKVSLRF